MKTCLLCNASSPDETVTCPNDGEASWGDAEAVHAPVVEHAEAAVEESVDPPKPKRSRR